MSAKESDRLFHHKDTHSHGIVCHSLGGKTYKIDPSRNKSSILRTAITWFMLLVLSPLLLLVTIMFVEISYTSPLAHLHHAILSIVVSFIMNHVALWFGPERDILLGDIGENDEVLDIGCGGGTYLRHYIKTSNIVALEPAVNMHDGIRQVAKQVGILDKNLTILPLTLEEYVNSTQQSGMQKQFDWIIVGNVLCEVSDPIAALEGIKILTKPGGHVYFSEHEGAASGTWVRRIQDMFNPVWVKVTDGCNCNRDTLQMIHSTLVDNWELAIWEYPHIQVALNGPCFIGLARKK